MKKLIYVVFLFLSISLLEARFCDLSWNEPQLTSQNSISYLFDIPGENQIMEIDLKKTFSDDPQFDFALSSFSKFQCSLSNFLALKNNSSFLYYKTPNKTAELLPHSSYLPPPNIPIRSMLKFNLMVGADHFSGEDGSYSFLYYGARISGYLRQRLFFYGSWWAGHFTGDMDEAQNSPLVDSWHQYSDDMKQLYLDNIKGRLTYLGPGNFWSVSLGRGNYQLGSNIGGSVILNDACNDYGYFSAKFIFDKFYLTTLQGALIPDSTGSAKSFPDKYIAIQKFGWTPSRNFELFVGEEVIYANRGLDLNYLLPHTFWRAVEHNLGDRDNALAFLGLNWRPVHNDLIYLNFSLDELKQSEMFGNWWGNKYAIQVGNSYSFSPKNDGVISLEFTAVRPWHYTHYILENKFSHYDISLGFPAGSNLIQYAAECNYEFRNIVNVNLHASYTRQGSVGNNFSINYNTRPSDKADWLEGDIDDTFTFTPILTWKIFAHHHLKTGIEYKFLKQHEQPDEQQLNFYLSYRAEY